jgi:hypothetical protein
MMLHEKRKAAKNLETLATGSGFDARSLSACRFLKERQFRRFSCSDGGSYRYCATAVTVACGGAIPL